MKKILSGLCAVLVSASLFAGFGAFAVAETTPGIDSSAKMLLLDYDDDDDDDDYAHSWNSTFDQKKVISEQAVKVYQYTDGKNVPWLFLVITNNSDYTLDLEATLRVYDAAGKIISVDDEGQDEFEKGSQTVLTYRLSETPAKYQYALAVEPEDGLDFSLSNLSTKSVKGAGKETVTVTNNSRRSAEDIDGTMLFLKNNKVVGFDRVSFLKNNQKLKSGASIAKDFFCEADYDSTILSLDAD